MTVTVVKSVLTSGADFLQCAAWQQFPELQFYAFPFFSSSCSSSNLTCFFKNTSFLLFPYLLVFGTPIRMWSSRTPEGHSWWAWQNWHCFLLLCFLILHVLLLRFPGYLAHSPWIKASIRFKSHPKFFPVTPIALAPLVSLAILLPLHAPSSWWCFSDLRWLCRCNFYDEPCLCFIRLIP